MGRGVRPHRWGYTELAEGKEGTELYAHATDPQEFHNLAHKPDYQTRATISRLRKHCEGKDSGKSPTSPFNPPRL